MNIKCPGCHTKYRLDMSAISENGTKVECSKCANIFIVRKRPISKVEKIIGNIKNNISDWERQTETASPKILQSVEAAMTKQPDIYEDNDGGELNGNNKETAAVQQKEEPESEVKEVASEVIDQNDGDRQGHEKEEENKTDEAVQQKEEPESEVKEVASEVMDQNDGDRQEPEKEEENNLQGEEDKMIGELAEELISQSDDESLMAALVDVEEKKETGDIETEEKKETETGTEAEAGTEVERDIEITENTKIEDNVAKQNTVIDRDNIEVPDIKEGNFVSKLTNKLLYYRIRKIILCAVVLFMLVIISKVFIIWMQRGNEDVENVINTSHQTVKNDIAEEIEPQQQRRVGEVNLGIILPVAYNTDETKIMSVDIRLRFDSDDAVKEMESSSLYYYEDIIESTIADFFKEVFYEDVTFAQDRLKREITVKLNDKIKKGRVETIDFENFLVQ